MNLNEPISWVLQVELFSRSRFNFFIYPSGIVRTIPFHYSDQSQAMRAWANFAKYWCPLIPIVYHLHRLGGSRLIIPR